MHVIGGGHGGGSLGEWSGREAWGGMGGMGGGAGGMRSRSREGGKWDSECGGKQEMLRKTTKEGVGGGGGGGNKRYRKREVQTPLAPAPHLQGNIRTFLFFSSDNRTYLFQADDEADLEA